MSVRAPESFSPVRSEPVFHRPFFEQALGGKRNIDYVHRQGQIEFYRLVFQSEYTCFLCNRLRKDIPEIGKMKNNPFFQSPIRLVISIAVSLVIAEAGIMVVLTLFPDLPRITGVFIDSILLLLLLIPSLTFFVFRPLILHITERKRVEEALRKSESQLRYLSSQILRAQEIERRRISRELHEELGQTLPALKLQLMLIEEKLREDQGPIKEDCENILKYIDQVVEGVRRLSQNLSPSIVEDFGIAIILRRLVNEFNERYQMNVSLQIDDIDDLFLQDSKIIIYRILQEALSNVGRHAQAKNVSIVIKKGGEKVFFHINDDGKGFDMKHAFRKEAAEKGWGLALMDERMRMLGGTLDVSSQEGKGTQITLTIPVKKQTRLLER